MKKRLLIVAVCAALCMVFFGSCTKTEEGKESGSTEVKESTPVTVRLITDVTSIADKSFNAAAWRGILNFYGDTWENTSKRGKYYDVVTCQTQDMYLPTLKQVSDEGYSLITATGFSFADSMTEVAALYPDLHYLIVDVDWLSGPNLMQATFAEEQGSYLVGVAAALKAQEDGIKNPKFGFIGGIAGTIITRFEIGFVQGVLSVLPDAQILDYYANDWGKPELAKTQAKNWYDSGVYAIFSAAGGTGNGTIAQAKEYRIQGKNVWAIGVDSDQYEDGIYAEGQSAVLTSMIKRVESATEYALCAVEAGTFTGEIVVLDMAKDGVDYSTKNSALSKSIIDKVNAVRKDIIDGKIKVYKRYADALDAKVVPAGLSAKDDQ
ncbi:BMP family ABC transporter substrate-binding protein [Treponema phagedenis]|uniref:Basic membrane protein n=1 Tax=Treponema phagedenis TaxID=162 RepID=A0A0B7H1U4_TREPH|nr:BMP family protein [Treponema phagedenis]QSH95672.1 BMP family ABC transporter substrate-binding protein [Treponema phagedenis]QSH99077.1 BMP family ABC transporter substrate-binding protein [Treponema phagedenis]CEM62916.1 Basic membrane protein [Treponema phagedenis]